uniref:UDP-glucuronosyltransferase n=1 Tax=Neogobius melanostomus TaxID=47308 RepID=A0A8C6U591_9GOBI
MTSTIQWERQTCVSLSRVHRNMRLPSPLLVFVFVQALGGVAWAGHVLVFPGEFSHWLNMRHLVEELQVRNHSISIMVPSASPQCDTTTRAAAEVPLHRLPEALHALLHVRVSRGVAAAEGQLRAGFMQLSMELQIQTCEAMVRNVTLMSQLRSAHFDGVLWDPMSPCGDLVAQLLDLPLIASLRLSFGAVIERHCGHAPLPPSYVPASPLPYSDHMTFSERVKNVLTNILSSVASEIFWKIALNGLLFYRFIVSIIELLFQQNKF